MPQGRPLPTIELTAEEQGELSGFAASLSLPHALVARAQLVLWSAEGVANAEIAERLNWSKPTVGDLRGWNLERLLATFGRHGTRLYGLARGMLESARILMPNDTALKGRPD